MNAETSCAVTSLLTSHEDSTINIVVELLLYYYWSSDLF